MLNIRMRASRETAEEKGTNKAVRQVHISGAEGICEEAEVGHLVDEYIRRAMEHSRGRPDRIDITIERIVGKPRWIRSLPVRTVQCRSPREAQSIIRRVLGEAGISEKAVEKALRIVRDDEQMRGAAVISSGSGKRLDPDRKRGIRASRLGIRKAAAVLLGQELARRGIRTATVVEALVLASKVISCPQVIAELCVSDDRDYTTGYISTELLGYVRIPHIKKKREWRGGRVFFVEDDADVNAMIMYLEKKPVVINRIAECCGVCSIDEVIGQHHI